MAEMSVEQAMSIVRFLGYKKDDAQADSVVRLLHAQQKMIEAACEVLDKEAICPHKENSREVCKQSGSCQAHWLQWLQKQVEAGK